MTRGSLLLVCCLGLGCARSRPPVVPTPAELAADTVRATLLAAMVDEPRNKEWRVVKEAFPRFRPTTSVAAVIAFLIDTTGTPEVETMSVFGIRGDSGFAKAVCETIPRVRFTAPEGSRRRSLLLVPFTSFRGNQMPGEFLKLPQTSYEKLENMSTAERRDFLLDKGCRRYR